MQASNFGGTFDQLFLWIFLWNFTEDASQLFLYHGAKKSKMTRNSNQGGPALTLMSMCFSGPREVEKHLVLDYNTMYAAPSLFPNVYISVDSRSCCLTDEGHDCEETILMSATASWIGSSAVLETLEKKDGAPYTVLFIQTRCLRVLINQGHIFFT